MTTYKIIRFYFDARPKKVTHRGLTLEAAQKHCTDPKTRKNGEWFDGYTAEE